MQHFRNNGGPDESGLGLTSHLLFFFLVVLIIRNIRKKIVLNFYSVLHFTLVKFCCLSKRFASS